MLVILLMCAPLEVADVIVLWIAVDVIDLWEVVWIGNPSLCNETMHEGIFRQPRDFFQVKNQSTIMSDLGF